MLKLSIDAAIDAVDPWLSVTVYLLIHTFHCIQGAYAAILMDASFINVTVTAMCHAEVQ